MKNETLMAEVVANRAVWLSIHNSQEVNKKQKYISPTKHWKELRIKN